MIVELIVCKLAQELELGVGVNGACPRLGDRDNIVLGRQGMLGVKMSIGYTSSLPHGKLQFGVVCREVPLELEAEVHGGKSWL